MGYITGKGSSKLAKVKVNLPLLFAASVLPDVDLLMRFLMHRGPTHSLITITVLMIPFFVVYRKQAIPYYAALLSHILIGDFFTNGVQLFWPLSKNLFGVLNINVTSLPNVIAELALFFITLPIIYKLGDLKTLLKSHNNNWTLIIPLGAVVGPLLTVGRGQEASLPTLLAVPSLFYVVLFGYSMFVELKAKLQSRCTRTKTYQYFMRILQFRNSRQLLIFKSTLRMRLANQTSNLRVNIFSSNIQKKTKKQFRLKQCSHR